MSDAQSVHIELANQVFVRPAAAAGSSVDWESITHVVIEWYAGHLELIRCLLEPAKHANVRRFVPVDISPKRAEDTVQCRTTTQMSRNLAALFTHWSTTRRTRHAIEGTLHEEHD